MKPIFADFNALTEAEHIRLTTRGSQDDLRSAGTQPGDWIWLSDGELEVGAQVATDPREILIGIPSWETLVDFESESHSNPASILSEFKKLLLHTPNRSRVDEHRLLTLLSVIERTPSLRSAWQPGHLSYLRACRLLALGQLQLARCSIEEAIELDSSRSNYALIHLDILRRIDPHAALEQADRLVENGRADAKILATCMILASMYSDSLKDHELEPIRERLQNWLPRFEQAPDFDSVHAQLRASLWISLGLLTLRLGHVEQSHDYFQLARQLDPDDLDLQKAERLTTYNQDAKDFAERIHRRPLTAA